MKANRSISFMTLLLLISFGSVNAVLFTPALPEIAHYFAISNTSTQQTISWFLIGYAIGQLIYGPLANRYGRKPALYIGISLQIGSSLVCISSGWLQSYPILIVGRFLLALGSGVGLKMTFTLINETCTQIEAGKKLSYLMIAFAVTPALGVMLGGFLTAHYGWESTFLAGAFYGILLLILVVPLPETKKSKELNALQFNHLIKSYAAQFRNSKLILAGLLMGCATSFVYIFAALAPFIAVNLLHMASAEYGIDNLLPSIGLLMGSLLSVQLLKHHSQKIIINVGIAIILIGSVLMLVFSIIKSPGFYVLFIPLLVTNIGLAFVFANASTVALSNVIDKAHGSAVMNFINMGFATVAVLLIGLLPTSLLLLPMVFVLICAGMIFISN